MVWRRVPLASRSSLGCYVLLLCVCCWDRYRVFWRHQSAADQSQRELSQWNGPSDHIFVYNTFLYDRRPPANDTSGGAIKLVVLFLAERVERPAQDEMRCVVSTNSLAVKRFSQRTEVVTSLGICALDLFVLTCTMDQLPPSSALFEGAERNQFSLILREKQGIGQAARVELQLSQPSYEPRGMVMCISRVFAYERWQLFITAMETYRQFKVDLVVTHVQSALAGLMALMRAYERQGLLAIRPGIHFPHRRDMRWDPNAETEFNGQILLAHECFYEFRESAQFIALIDWDDLLVPSGHFPSLPAAFSAATAALSNARSEPAYFLVNKLEASFVEQSGHWRPNPQRILLLLFSNGPERIQFAQVAGEGRAHRADVQRRKDGGPAEDGARLLDAQLIHAGTTRCESAAADQLLPPAALGQRRSSECGRIRHTVHAPIQHLRNGRACRQTAGRAAALTCSRESASPPSLLRRNCRLPQVHFRLLQEHGAGAGQVPLVQSVRTALRSGGALCDHQKLVPDAEKEERTHSGAPQEEFAFRRAGEGVCGRGGGLNPKGTPEESQSVFRPAEFQSDSPSSSPTWPFVIGSPNCRPCSTFPKHSTRMRNIFTSP